MNHSFQVIFEDNHILVVIKPVNILSQADSTGDLNMVDLVNDYLRTKYNKPGKAYVGLLHRLDRPVSGLMIFAKTSKSFERLQEQIKFRTMDKYYLAVTANKPPNEEDTLRHFILKDSKINKVMISDHEVTGSKVCQLRYRVLGMAGVLDTARLRSFVAEELHVSGTDVQAMVLGGHGDTMVPLVRQTTVAGTPITDRLSQERLAALIKRTQDGGAEIVGLLKTGSAFYAPSAAAVDMVESIMNDQKRVLPCAMLCEGEYGLKGVIVGVPVTLGRAGGESIVEYDLTTEERRALQASADAVRELCAVVDRLLTA